MGNCNNLPQQQESEIKNEENQNDLKVTGVTWTKDSHGLFDYETKNTIKNHLKIGQSGRIVRKNNQIEFQQEDQVQNEDAEILLDVQKDENGLFWLNLKNQEEPNDNWTIVKHIPSEKGYKLRPGDKLKLGRVKFKVMELILDQNWQKNLILDKKQTTNQLQGEIDQTDIVTDFEYHQTQDIQQIRKYSQNNNNENNSQLDIQNISDNNLQQTDKTNNNTYIDQNNQQNQKICRICLSEETSDNPLVNPCKCIGSMKYLHLNCLQQWIYSKMQSSNKHTQNLKLIFLSKQFECEVCKSKYPCRFQSEGNYFDMYELAKPIGHPYVGIEIMQVSQNRTNYAGYYIIQLKKKQTQKLNIGRSHESELRISDISVSRQHACIYWDGEQLYLQDTQSKFGSLVQINQEIPLTNDLDGFAVQCGRSTLQFHLSNGGSGCQMFKSCMNQIQSTQSDDDTLNQINQQQQQDQ